MFLAALGCAVAVLLKQTGAIVPVVLVGYAIVEGWGSGRIAKNLLRCLNGFLLMLMLMWVLLKFDMSPVRERGILPGGIYFVSLLDAARHVREPNDAFLNGQIRRGGWWYYFPVVATYKVPAAVLGMMLLAGGFAGSEAV